MAPESASGKAISAASLLCFLTGEYLTHQGDSATVAEEAGPKA